MDCLRDRVIAMEHNLATLRTRLTQVADLRDAQGIREDHRAIIARHNEVEECATVHTLREFMSKICRLEAMFTGEDGGVIFQAIRACNRRIDSQQPLDRSANLLNQIAQIVITYHNERVGRPLIDETCRCKGVNESNKIMVFLPGLAQIYQLCEILQRALDLGWTEMLVPLPFHGK